MVLKAPFKFTPRSIQAPTELVDVLRAAGCDTDLPPPPDCAGVLLSPKEVAQIFGRNPQTPKRWKRRGWILPCQTPRKAIRYGAPQIASLAFRLFRRFGGGYDEKEAKRLGVVELLEWVNRAASAERKDPADSGPVLIWLLLAALADDHDSLPPALCTTEQQLNEIQPEAKRQLRQRLQKPGARAIMVRAFVQSGIVASTS